MAITHVGSHSTTASNNTTGFAIAVTTDVLTNDILILSCTNKGATSDPSTPTDDESGGNAWQKLTSGNNGVSNSSVWWKRIVADTTSTINITGSGFTKSCAAVVSIYRGCSTIATPYENATVEANASGDESHASITPTVDGCLVCLSVSNTINDIAVSSEASVNVALTERAEDLNVVPPNKDCAAVHASGVQTTAGATGAFTWTQSDSVTISIVFDIRPIGAINYTLTTEYVGYSYSGSVSFKINFVTSKVDYTNTVKPVLFAVNFTTTKADYTNTFKTANLYIPNKTTSATLYFLRDNSVSGWDKPSDTWSYIDDVDYVANTDYIRRTTFDDTSIWESQLKIYGHTVPKSAGYLIDSSGAGTFCFSFDAYGIGGGIGKVVYVSCGLYVADDYRWSAAPAFYEVARAWHKQQLTDSAYNTGPVTEIRTASSTFATVYIGLNTTGTYDETAFLRLYSYRLRLKIYRDRIHPSAPSTLRVGGYMLPFNHIEDDIETSLFPTLSVIYRDSSNATYADGYDESSYVQWIIGQNKVGSGDEAYITSTFYTGIIATIGLPDTNLIIAWPTTASLIASSSYYARARVWDANHNAGAWSSIMAFTTGPKPDYAWWDDRWTRRAQISFGQDHDIIKKGYTARVGFNTGNIQTVATNGFINEEVYSSAADMVRRGNKTYFTYRGSNPAAIHVSYYNHDTASFGTVIKVTNLAALARYDAHYSPVLGVCGSNHIHVVLSGHGDSMHHYRSVNTMDINSWEYVADMGTGTYPRLITDDYGRLICFYRWIAEYWSYSVYNPFTTATWSAKRYHFISFDELAAPPLSNIPPRTLYSPGVRKDKLGNIHFAYNYMEGYLGVNKARSVGYAWAPVHNVPMAISTWYNLAGEPQGHSSTTWLDMQTLLISYAGNPGFSSGDVYSAPYFTNIEEDIGPWPCTNCQGLEVFPSGTVAFVFGNASLWGSTTPRYVPCEGMLALSQAGSVWATINFTKLSNSPKIWEYRYIGRISIVDSPLHDNKIIKIYGTVVPPTTQKYFGGEIGCWTSYDMGDTWGFNYVTKNSSGGIPMIIGVASRWDKDELLIGRMGNVEYWTGDSPGTTFKISGDDIRIVHGTCQLDRVPANFFNYDNTLIDFKVQSTIGANSAFPEPPYFIYYGNYFASATPPADPNNVYRFFEGWEGYGAGDTPTHSIGGWHVTPTANTYNHIKPFLVETSKSAVGPVDFYSGYKSLDSKYTSGGNPPVAYLWRSIPTTATYFEMSIVYRAEENTSAAGATHLQICKVSVFGTPDFYYHFRVADDQERIVHRSSVNPTPWIYYSAATFLYRINYTQRLICGSNLKLYTQGIQTGNLSTFDKITYPNILATVSFKASQNYYSIDHIIFKDYMDNPPECSPTLWEIKNYTGETKISNYALVSYIRARRLSSILVGELTLKQRIANEILGDKTFVNRIASYITTDKHFYTTIANVLQGELTLQKRMASIICGDKRVYNKLASVILGDKELITRITNIVDGDKPATEKMAMMAIVDKEVTGRLAASVFGDKELAYRLSMAISGDKFLVSRLMNITLTDKVRTGELANIIIADKENTYKLALRVFGDKETANKIANTITLEDVLEARIYNYLVTSKFLTDRAANILRGDKEFKIRLSGEASFIKSQLSQMAENTDLEATRQSRLSEMLTLLIQRLARVSMDVSLEKGQESRLSEFVTIEKVIDSFKFDQYVDLLALKMSVFSQKPDFAKDFYKKLVETVQLQKDNFDNKYVQIVDFICHEMLSFSEDSAFIAEKVKGFAEDASFLAVTLAFARFAEEVSLSKTTIMQFVENLNLDKATFDSIVEDIDLLKSDQIKISEVVTLQEVAFKRFVEDADFRKIFAAYFAEDLSLSKDAQKSIAETLDFLKELVEYSRFAEVVTFNKVLLTQFVENLNLDKTVTDEITEDIRLIKSNEVRLSEVVTLQAVVFKRFIEDAEFRKTFGAYFTETTSFLKEAQTGFAETADFIESTLAYLRFVETVYLDKTIAIRFAETLGLDKQELLRIVEAINLNKSDKISLAEIVDLQATTFERFIEGVEFRKDFAGFFAETAGLSKLATGGIAETINFLVTTIGTGRLAEYVALEKTQYGRFFEGMSLVANKMGKFSELLNLVATDLIKFSEKTDFSKLASQTGYAQYIQLSEEEMLTKRIAAFIELSASRQYSITELVSLIKVFIPDLVFVRNYSLVHSTFTGGALSSSNLDDMEII